MPDKAVTTIPFIDPSTEELQLTCSRDGCSESDPSPPLCASVQTLRARNQDRVLSAA